MRKPSSSLNVELLEQRLVPSALPRPDHVVVVFEENHAYQDIIGSSAAPYINSLASQQGANMTNYFGISHPSEGNYLDLYSGSDQGSTADGIYNVGSLSTPNIGQELLNAGLTWGAYIEGAGTPVDPNNFDTDHAPWGEWNNNGTPGTEHDFSQFPTTAAGFASLPTLSLVTPNLINDMHDGTVQQGDAWLQQNMDGYAQWAKTHNSLLVVVWDEDPPVPNAATPPPQIATGGGQVACIFVGAGITPGQYGEAANHFSLLSTMEALYELPYTGSAQAGLVISDIFGSQPPPPPPTPLVPGPPTGLTASTISSSEIDVSWTPADATQTGFTLERSTAGSAFTVIATLPASQTTYQDTGLSAATTYQYAVAAYNGVGSSAYAAAVSAQTLPLPAPPPSPPAAPTGLTATAVSSTELDLSWTPGDNTQTGFTLERSTDGVTFGPLASTTAPSYRDTGLSASTTYTYEVSAFNSAGSSPFTAPVTAITLGPPPPPPPPVQQNDDLVVSGFPSPVKAGTRRAFTVTVLTPSGTVDSAYTGTVHFTSSDGQAVLPTDYTFTSDDAGSSVFLARLKTAGPQSLTVMDVSSGAKASQDGIVVTAAAAARLGLTAPVNATVGTPFKVTVTAYDTYNNVAGPFRGTVAWTSTDHAAALPANYRFTSTDAGVHTFTLTLGSSGMQTLSVHVVSNSSISGSSTVTVANVLPPPPPPPPPPPTSTGPQTSLHYTPNGNVDAAGNYLPGAYGFNLADVGPDRGAIDALPAGVKALVWLGDNAADYQTVVTPLIGDSKVYGFYLADEPTVDQFTPASFMAESDWIHTNDPGTVTFIALSNVGSDESPTYAGTYTPANTHIDLVGLDPYPVRTDLPNSFDPGIITKAVFAAEAVGWTQAQIVPIYQAFGGTGPYLTPTASQELTMLALWATVTPTPAFDYAYSFGVQYSGETALSTSPDLQAVFKAHNDPPASIAPAVKTITISPPLRAVAHRRQG